METRPCTKCGQHVSLARDSCRVSPGGGIEHTSCPTSPALKNLPAAPAPGPARPQYLTMQDAAQMLAVSIDTIRRRIRSGELPAVRLRGAADGGRQTVLINQADVLALLEPYTGAEVGG